MQGIDVWARSRPVAQTGTFRVEFDPQSPGEDVDALVNAGPILGIVNANLAAGLPPFQENLLGRLLFARQPGRSVAGGRLLLGGRLDSPPTP